MQMLAESLTFPVCAFTMMSVARDIHQYRRDDATLRRRRAAALVLENVGTL